MNIETLTGFLLRCTVINFAVLLLWVVVFVVARESLHSLTNKWFRLSAEQFDAVQYEGIILYKVGIWLFNLAPYIALRTAG